MIDQSVEVVGLVMLAIMPKDKREALCESDFDHLKSAVVEIKAKPIPTLKDILRNKWGYDWDGKEPISDFLVNVLRCDCLCEKAFRAFEKKRNDVASAYRYIEHFTQMSNWKHQPDSEVMIHLRKCRELLVESITEPELNELETVGAK